MLINILDDPAKLAKIQSVGKKYGMTISNIRKRTYDYAVKDGVGADKHTASDEIDADLKYKHGADLFSKKTLVVCGQMKDGTYSSSFKTAGKHTGDPTTDITMNEHPGISRNIYKAIGQTCAELHRWQENSIQSKKEQKRQAVEDDKEADLETIKPAEHVAVKLLRQSIHDIYVENPDGDQAFRTRWADIKTTAQTLHDTKLAGLVHEQDNQVQFGSTDQAISAIRSVIKTVLINIKKRFPFKHAFKSDEEWQKIFK